MPPEGHRRPAPENLFLLTSEVRQARRPFFKSKYALPALSELRRLCTEHPAPLVAYVLLPEMARIIVQLPRSDPQNFLGKFQSAVSQSLFQQAVVNKNDKLQRWLGTSEKPSLWDPERTRIQLLSGPAIRRAIDQLHASPTTQGLVPVPADYPWSSLGAYFSEWGFVPPIPVDMICQ